jgi:uncharacterized protein YlxW (UPF0749 family)
MSRRAVVYQVGMTLLMLALGIVIAAQVRSQGHLYAAASSQDEQLALLTELVAANQSLRLEIEALEEQQASYAGNERSVGLESLVAELNRVRVLNGMIEVSGPGVELLVDGPLNALDLQDLINELRNAGAEAVALNGQRLAASSVLVVENKTQITMDGQLIRRPYRFKAIGDPDTLETALLRPGGLVLLLRHTYPNLLVQSTRQSRMVLGIRRAQAPLQYIQPVERSAQR